VGGGLGGTMTEPKVDPPDNPYPECSVEFHEVEMIRKLFPINCFYNHEPDANRNDKCFSKSCMLNQNKKVKRLIQKNGCLAYKKIKYPMEVP
jgi:hypothetical protein